MSSIGWVIIDGVMNLSSIGATSGGTGPVASSGAIRLANGASINARNASNTADGQLLSLDGSNILQLGNAVSSIMVSQGVGTPLLMFGGATSAFPALRRSGGNLEVIKADASAYSTLNVSAVGFLSNQGFLTTTSNGVFVIENAAATAGVSFDVTTDSVLKVFARGGGNTGQIVATKFNTGLAGTDIMWKAVSTTWQARLGDDSNNANLQVQNLAMIGSWTRINNVVIAGNIGVPAVYGIGRSTAQTAAVASVATFTPAADASLYVSMNVLVTTSTTHTFTCECAYTSEDNVARVLTFLFVVGSGSSTPNISNANGAGPYGSVPQQIRVKGGTSVTLRTQAAGTYTTVTFNVEGAIIQIT